MKKIQICLILVFLPLALMAQKRAIKIEDFANWNRIEQRKISNDGKFVAYELNKQKGDGSLVIKNLSTKKDNVFKFGYGAQFSSNNDFIAFKIKPSSDTIRKAKLKKLKKDKMPKDSVGIFIFSNQKLNKFPKVKSFKLAEENSSWIAVLLEPQKEKKDTTKNKKEDSGKKKEEGKTDENDIKVADLLIYNPTTEKQFRYKNVVEYVVAKKGGAILFSTYSNDSTKLSAIEVFNTKSEKISTAYSDTGTIKKLTIDEGAKYASFLHSTDTVKEKTYSLYQINIKNSSSTKIVDGFTDGMPKGWVPSEHGNIYFSEDGSKLFFGTAKKPVVKSNDSILKEEIPHLDIWSWTDIELQPMQLKKLEKEKKRTFLAVYRINEKKIFQLADTLIRNVRLINKNNGEFALGSTDRSYVRASSWSGKWLNDYYLINLKNGTKELFLTEKAQAQLSPAGRFILWYEQADSCYYALENATKKIRSLTKSLSVAFYDELNDIPNNPWPYGVIGWTKNDKNVFVSDRYDIWKLSPDNKENPVNITKNYGRDNKTRFSYIKLDKELVYIPESENVLLKAFNEDTYKEGYFTSKFSSSKAPVALLFDDYKFNYPLKAKDKDVLLWTKQSCKVYPDLHVSGLNFKDKIKISDANPQQVKYNWATVEKLEWVSFAGDTLRGLLYKPENFSPSKKYPVVVYFYERSSEGIHWHSIPSPSRSIINKTFYASNDYIVFVPDIVYKIGYPGQSAYDAIVSGCNYLSTTRNYIDRNKMGLQGQSWGGYQTAYLVTQTDMFAAAMAGAPVSNMTSAYGGIRWGTGMSRMFQYEHTQSRIGGTLWEKPMLYIENSPLFYVPKVKTPLLIMHNDNDGAVPWYQGIELFVALRRLNKPAWMLTYNGINHNIDSKFWANRIDLSKRMLQFFDHYLKGEKPPEWMTKGVPAIEKGENLGY